MSKNEQNKNKLRLGFEPRTSSMPSKHHTSRPTGLSINRSQYLHISLSYLFNSTKLSFKREIGLSYEIKNDHGMPINPYAKPGVSKINTTLISSSRRGP